MRHELTLPKEQLHVLSQTGTGLELANARKGNQGAHGPEVDSSFTTLWTITDF